MNAFLSLSKRFRVKSKTAAESPSAAVFVLTIILSTFITLLFSSFLYVAPPLFAAEKAVLLPQNEQEAQALYLRLQEVEATLTRIEQDIQTTQKKSAQTRAEIARVQEERQALKKDVLPILRSRYTVRPLNVWLKLLFLSDWQTRLYTEDMFQYILKRHQHKITIFLEKEKQMQALLQEELSELDKLSTLRATKDSERSKLKTVIEAWEAHLATQKDPAAYEQAMERFYRDWQTHAEPALNILLNRLNAAYIDMPGTFQDKVKINLNGAQFTLSDQELTEYLRAYDPIFQGVDVAFIDHAIQITIDLDPVLAETRAPLQNDSQKAGSPQIVSLHGHYERAEGKLGFIIDEMLYGDLLLPPEVVRKLEAQYQLGIDPSAIHPRLSISNFDMRDGLLTLWFTFQL